MYYVVSIQDCEDSVSIFRNILNHKIDNKTFHLEPLVESSDYGHQILVITKGSPQKHGGRNDKFKHVIIMSAEIIKIKRKKTRKGMCMN